MPYVCRGRGRCLLGGWWRLVLSVGLMVLVMPASAAGVLRWSAPRLIDHEAPFAFGDTFAGVSCPAKRLCVAVAGAPYGGQIQGFAAADTGVPGQILVSRDPLSVRPTWTAVDVGDAALTAVSCPVVSMCVATDDRGRVLVTHDPLRGARGWHAVRVDGRRALTSLSCPTVRLCVAVDSDGGVVSSVDPRPRAGAWKRIEVHHDRVSPYENVYDDLIGVSCASVSLCVAVDPNRGAVLSSTHPTGGRRTWRAVTLDRSGPVSSDLPDSLLGGASCASVRFCLVSVAGEPFVSTRPAGGRRVWRGTDPHRTDPELGSVRCLSAAFCIGVSNGNDLLSTVHPGRGPRAWQTTSVGESVTDISCPSPSACVAVDDDGNVITSTHPRGGRGRWTVRSIAGVNPIDAISCPAVSLCVAVDAAGNVLSSTRAWSPSAHWRITPVDPPEVQAPASYPYALADISCPSVNLCVTTDGAFGRFASTDPTGGTDAWTHPDYRSLARLRLSVATDPYQSIACPSRTLCITVGTDGAAITRDPADPAAVWRPNDNIDPDPGPRSPPEGQNPLTDIACPTASLCVAVDEDANALASTTPGATNHAWATAPLPLPRGLAGNGAFVSCASAKLCVALGTDGDSYITTDPADPAHWTRDRHPAPDSLDAIDCRSQALCVAVGSHGTLAASVNLRPWTRTTVNDAHTLTDISCPTTTRCIAVDDNGDIVLGTTRQR